jgi:hypothetical protein
MQMREKEVEGRMALEGCPNPVHLVNRFSGKHVVKACRRRRCPWCGPNHWVKFVQAKMMRGLEGIKREEVLLLTLTAPGDATRPWNEQAALRFNRFITALRRAYPGTTISYMKFGEYQRRGLIHYHIIAVGLRYLPHQHLRALAVRCGFGPRVGVMHPDPAKGGFRGLLGYYGKYLVKGMFVWQERSHVVSSSEYWSWGWQSRRRGCGCSGWYWVPDGEAAEHYLVNMGFDREAVKGAVVPAPDNVATLTAGPSPPFTLGVGGCRLAEAAPPYQGRRA